MLLCTQSCSCLVQLRHTHSSIPGDPSDARRRDVSLLDKMLCCSVTAPTYPTQCLQRPRPTTGAKDSQFPPLHALPRRSFDVSQAAFSATTYDARREHGSLLSKTDLTVPRHDPNSTHSFDPFVRLIPSDAFQRPRPTRGVEGSQLLLSPPRCGYAISSAALLETMSDARHSSGSLL